MNKPASVAVVVGTLRNASFSRKVALALIAHAPHSLACRIVEIGDCLKNAVDVGSRPQGKNVFDGLPAGVVSVTPYKMGAFGANHALRQTFAFLNLLVMQQPEAYIGGVAELFDDLGALKCDETKTFFHAFLAAFDSWVHRFAE